jgi:hypothetical protein
MPRHELRAAAALLLLFFVSAARISPAQASEGHTFIFAVAEGYGIEDCLAEGGECGRAVADAWCEAHGHGAALAFGVADDVTGAISSKTAAREGQRPYMVRCGD